MTDSEELRKLAEGLAKLYGWDIANKDPKSVTNLLMRVADRVEIGAGVELPRK